MNSTVINKALIFSHIAKVKTLQIVSISITDKSQDLCITSTSQNPGSNSLVIRILKAVCTVCFFFVF